MSLPTPMGHIGLIICNNLTEKKCFGQRLSIIRVRKKFLNFDPLLIADRNGISKN